MKFLYDHFTFSSSLSCISHSNALSVGKFARSIKGVDNLFLCFGTNFCFFKSLKTCNASSSIIEPVRNIKLPPFFWRQRIAKEVFTWVQNLAELQIHARSFYPFLERQSGVEATGGSLPLYRSKDFEPGSLQNNLPKEMEDQLSECRKIACAILGFPTAR